MSLLLVNIIFPHYFDFQSNSKLFTFTVPESLEWSNVKRLATIFLYHMFVTSKYAFHFKFGTAFILGRHEWFALGFLITNWRNSALSGVAEIVFFNKPHKWMEKQRIGYRKGYSMDHYGTETPQPTSRFNMTDRLTQSSLSVAQHCSDFIYILFCEI